MTTEQEWNVPKPLNGDVFPPGPTATDNVAAKLETDLQGERDSRREERFYWIFALVMVGNVPIFNGFESAWALLPTFLLELVILIGLADWLGVDRVKVLLERIYAKWLSK
jgi:hypothetical protein